MLHRAHFTAESEYGGGNPGNLRFQYYLFPATIASWFGGGTGWNWLKQFRCICSLGNRFMCYSMRLNHLLLFLLHGVGFQPA